MKNQKTTWQNLSFIFKNIQKVDKTIFPICLINSIAVGIEPFIWIIVPKLIIDELQGQGRQEYILMVLASTFIIGGIVYFLIEYLKGKYRMKMSAVRFHFIEQVNHKAMEMPYALTEDPKTLNQIRQAWKTIRNPVEGIGLIMRKIVTFPGSIIGFFGYSAIISTLNPLVLIYFIINIMVAYIVHNKLNIFYKETDQAKRPLEREMFYYNRTLSDFKYGKDIRLYSLKDLVLDKVDGLIHNIINLERDIVHKKWQGAVIDGILLLLREGLIYAYVIYKVLNGMAIGDFLMYTVAIGGFAIWMENLIKDYVQLKKEVSYIDDLQIFLEIEEANVEGKMVKIQETEQYEIIFDHVSFKYPHSEKYIFKDLNLKIKAGEKLAIVGINGAGKTTLVKLLLRFYPVTEGAILLNGVNINDYALKEYHNLFSVVFQDITKLPFSIAENISLEVDEYDRESIAKVSEQAGILDKINQLPNKFDTSLLKIIDENGVDFSGGETQKFGLARALYKNGEIVILDEPTAALDPIAEKDIYEGFNQLIRGRSAIYISHRLSSTKFCDQIAFFKDGRIQEYGTHEDLMAREGAYAKMFEIQAMYYKEDLNYVEDKRA